MACKHLFLLFLLLASFLAIPFLTCPIQAQTLMSMQKTVVSTTSDGHLNYTFSNYLATHNYATGVVYDTIDNIDVGQWWDGVHAKYVIQRAFLFFDLASALPSDATITAATLGLYVYTDNSTVDFNVTICNGQPTYPHDPLQSGDYNYLLYTSTGDFNSTSGWAAGAYRYINFTDAYLSWLSMSTTTKLTLRSDREIAGTVPTVWNNEFVSFYSRNKGEAYAPCLVLTYTTYAYQYIFHGPFLEDGTVSSDNATIVYYPIDGAAANFTIPSNSSYLYSLFVTTGLAYFYYNITSASYNISRSYYVEASDTDFYIFLPHSSESFSQYGVQVIDLAGLGNDGYITTNINVNGTSRTVEKYKVDVFGTTLFWLIVGRTYDIKISSDLGVFTDSNFVAAQIDTKRIVITGDMFARSTPENPLTVSAERKNATWIQANYSNTEATTIWIEFTIQYVNVNTWTTAISSNNTMNATSIQYNWYSADNETDYRFIMLADIAGTQYRWTWDMPYPYVTTSPFDLSAFGNWPVPSQYVFGALLIIICFGCFTYIDLALGCTTTWILAGFLTFLAWLPGASTNWIMWGSAGILVFFVDLKEAKKVEREI